MSKLPTSEFQTSAGSVMLRVPAGSFTEFQNGTAQVTGTLARIAQLDDQWQMTLLLNQRVDPGQANHPPPSRPALG
jgi:hypothetical protein